LIFTNDPLLQGRLFSYTDTQLSRLGGPNFHEIPINRPIAPMHNNQRDGIARMEINKSKTAYFPNSISDNSPKQAKAAEGGFTSYQERVDSYKIRTRSKSFLDFFSQATLFYNSQSEPEQSHIQDALKFELGKLERPEIAERVVGLLTQIDKNLAAIVAKGLGMEVPQPKLPINHQYGADDNPDDFQPITVNPKLKNSPALSMAHTVKDTIKTRQIAFLAADGVDADSLSSMKKSLENEGAMVKVIAPHGGFITDSKGNKIKVDKSFLAFASVLVDAIYIPSGEKSINALMAVPAAIHFINETFTHCKALAFCGDAKKLFDKSYVSQKLSDKKAIEKDEALIMMDKVTKDSTQKFITAIANHRFWPREKGEKVPC
jgi:catalase